MDPYYRAQRMLYTDHPTPFDPLSNPAYLAQLRTRALGVATVWFFGEMLLGIGFGLLAIWRVTSFASDPYASFSGDGPDFSFLTTWFVLGWIWTLTLLVAVLVIRIPAQISQWSLTLDGQAGATGRALGHMMAVLEVRRAPLEGISVTRLSAAGDQPRDYIHLRDGHYSGFLTAFGYGTDLMVGWTLWINLAPWRWLFLLVRRMVKGLTLSVHESLVFDIPKAVRELMHSAALHAVQVAEGGCAPSQPVRQFSVTPVAVGAR